LAIVCKCELEIRNFVPQAYFEVVATATVASGSVTLPYNEREVSASRELSGHFDRGPPRAHRRSAKHAFRLG
jgi:DNA topoisomerase IA